MYRYIFILLIYCQSTLAREDDPASRAYFDKTVKKYQHMQLMTAIGKVVDPNEAIGAVVGSLSRQFPQVVKNFFHMLDEAPKGALLQELGLAREEGAMEAAAKARAEAAGELAALTEERDAFARQVEEQKKALIETEEKTTTLGTTNKSLVRQLEEQKRTLTATIEEKDTLIRQLEKQKAMTLEAEGKRDAFARQVEEQKKALIETEAKTTTLGTTNKSLVRQLEEQKRTLTATIEEKDTLIRQLEEQKAMTLEAEGKRDALTHRVAELETQLEEQRRTLTATIEEKDKEIERSSSTLSQVRRTAKTAATVKDNKIEEHQKEIERLKAQLDTMKQTLEGEIEKLQEKLSQKERESQQVKDEIEEVRVERSASIRTNGKEIRALKTKLEQTEIQLAEYKKMFNDQLGTIGALDGWDHISEAQLRARIKEAENKKKPSSLKARTATVEVPDNRSDTGSVRSTRSRFSLSSLWGGGTPKAAPRRTSLEPQDPVADDPSTAEAFDHAGAFSTPIVGERAIEKDQADGATDSLSDVSLNEEKAEQKPASGSSGGGILGWFNRKPSTPIAAPNPPAPQKDADGSKYTYTTGTPRSLGGNTPKSSSPLNPNPLTSPVLTQGDLHTPVKTKAKTVAAAVTGGRPSDASSETNELDSDASSAASSPARMVSHKPAKPSPLRSGNTPSRPAQLDTKEEGLFGGESPDRPQPFGPVKLESDDRAKSSSLARSRSDGRPAPISTGSPPLTNRGLARSASVGPRERSHSADSNERKDSPIVVAEGFQRALPLGISPMKGGAFDFPAASVHDGKDLKQANSVSPITDNRETEAPQPISTSEDNALSSAVPAPSISPHAGTPGKDYQASSTENPQKKKRPSLVVNTTAPGASAAPPPPSSLKEGGLKQKGPRSLPSSPTAATVARASSALKESPPASSKGMQPSASPTNHMPAK